MLDECLRSIAESETNNDSLREKAKTMLLKLQSGGKVSLLKKSLCLRQAGKYWYDKLDKVLRKHEALPCGADPCMYRIGRGKNLLMIAVYVDDIIVFRDVNALSNMKAFLLQEFETRDLGHINYCLGIQFIRDKGKIIMHQKRYIEDILSRFGMSECNPASIPMDPNVKLTLPEEISNPETDTLPYRELIGSLSYLATTTRPDVAFAVSSLSQFCNSHGTIHWTSAKRVLRYLKGTSHLGLIFQADFDSLKGFVNADWGGCMVDRRSFTGYTFALSKCAVS